MDIYLEAQDYSRIYSLHGLEEFVSDTNDKINKLEKERVSWGKSWTRGHIESWIKWHNEEIEEEKEKLQMYEMALILKRNGE